MFPEITFQMFCERLANLTGAHPETKKPSVIFAEDWFRAHNPDAKMPERTAAVCDYCNDRELMLSAGAHYSLAAYFAKPDTTPTQQPPVATATTTEVVATQPATQPAAAASPVETPVQPAANPSPAPVAVTLPVAEAPNLTPAAPKRKRGKSVDNSVPVAAATGNRGIFTGHTAPPLAGRVIAAPISTATTVLPGEFMSDDGQLLEFTVGQVVADNSPTPAPLTNPQNYTLTVNDDVEADVNLMLRRGTKPENFDKDLFIGSTDVGEGLRFNLFLVAEDQPFVDGFLHDPSKVDPNGGDVIPLAELSPRYYSMTGTYSFQLGSRSVIVEVRPESLEMAASKRVVG